MLTVSIFRHCVLNYFRLGCFVLESLIKLHVPRLEDSRGWFREVNLRELLNAYGIKSEFNQLNHNHSPKIDTLRGLHFQLSPFAQAKLVYVIRGSIVNVAVDARKSSLDFGTHETCKICENSDFLIFLPAGFMHGILTLEQNTEVMWFVDRPYVAEASKSVKYDDHELNIDWGLEGRTPILSDKDINALSWSSYCELI